MTDPIADLLTRLRNGFMAKHESVKIPASQVKEAILKILKDEGFISQYIKEEIKPQSNLKVFLKYDSERKSVIRHLTRVSTPGNRVYQGYKELKPFLKGIGVRIISTPQGLLTDSEARKARLGGEVLCEVS